MSRSDGIVYTSALLDDSATDDDVYPVARNARRYRDSGTICGHDAVEVVSVVAGVASIVASVLMGLYLPNHSEDPRPWREVSEVVGWLYFFAWSLSFYPQVLLNYKRQSVVGYSLDYLSLNVVGFVGYSVFNCAFYFSTSVQHEYKAHHNGKPNLVRLDDVVFALHAALLTFVQVYQTCVYDRGAQRVTPAIKYGCVVVVVVSVAYAAAVQARVFGYDGVFQWLDVMYFLSGIKLMVTLIKYMPQAYLNYKRKSTVGWTIYNVLLDFTGGLLSLAQLVIDGWSTHDFKGVVGDPVKAGLGFTSIVFDVLFMLQHYVWYKHNREDTALAVAEARRNYANSDTAMPVGAVYGPTVRM